MSEDTCNRERMGYFFWILRRRTASSTRPSAEPASGSRTKLRNVIVNILIGAGASR